MLIDCGTHPRHGGEIRFLEPVTQCALVAESKRHLPFHQGSPGDPPRGRMILLHLGGLAAEGQGTDHQGALGHGVHLSVGGFQRGHQEGPAGQVLGIAHGRHLDVDLVPGPGKGRQLGGDDDRGNIVDFHIGGIDGHPQALHHVDQRLSGELGTVAVPGPVEPDHQPVTDQLVGTDTFEACQLLDPRCMGGRKQRTSQECHQDEDNFMG